MDKIEELIDKTIAEMGDDVSAKDKEFQKKLLEKVFLEGEAPRNVMNVSEDDMEFLYEQAYVLYNGGKYQDALDFFKLILTLDDRDPRFSFGIASCYHMLKDYDNAIKYYMFNSMVDESNPMPFYHMSDCFLKKKDVWSAMIILHHMIRKIGDDAPEEHKAIKDRASMTLKRLMKDYKAQNTKRRTKKSQNAKR